MEVEEQLINAGIINLGATNSEYKAFDVLASWSDNADSISYENYILITNSPSIFLPNLIHDEMDLPWTSSDHGYNNVIEPGFSYSEIKITNGKYLNSFDEIINYISKTSNSGHHYSKLDIINNNWQDNKVEHLLLSTHVNDTLQKLGNIREKQIKQEKEKLHQEQANAEVEKIANTIINMSDENKNKLLKLILK